MGYGIGRIQDIRATDRQGTGLKLLTTSATPADGKALLYDASGNVICDFIKEANLSLSDVTTADVSIARHGLAPKLPNDVTKFLNGVGAWMAPAGGGLGSATQVDVTTSRALDSVYQNTRNYPLLISVHVNSTSSGTAFAYTDSSNPPTSLYEADSTYTSGGTPVSRPLTFVVMPGNYYKVTHDTTATLAKWMETELPVGVKGDKGDKGDTGLPGDVVAPSSATPGHLAVFGATPQEIEDGGAVPSGGGGGLVLLEQHAATSSASLDFTACISSSYDEYEISLLNIVPATNGDGLILLVSTDGVNYDVTSGHYASTYSFHSPSSSSPAAGGVASAAAISLVGTLTISNDASKGGVSGTFRFKNPGNAAGYKMLGGSAYLWISGYPAVKCESLGTVLLSAAVVKFRIKATTGNITSGTVRVYGVAQ